MFSHKDNVHKVEKYDVDKIDDLEEFIKFESAEFGSDDDNDDDDSLVSDNDTDLRNLDLDFDFSNPNVTFVEKVENIITKHSNASLRTLSILNRAQVSLLQEGIKKREKLLEECRMKKMLIRQQIEEIQKEAQESVRTCFYVLGAPFFKNHFYAPPNEDALQRKARGELSLVDLPTCKVWLKTDKSVLTIAVRKQSKQIRIKKIEQRMQQIVSILKKNTAGTDVKALKKELKSLEQSLLHWQSKEPSECIFSRDEQVAIDWLKIMTIDLQGRHDDEECKAMWYMYLHPDINKSAWSKAENANLQKLAEKYNYQDWNSIASELSTNRSEYQCCVQFQTKLSNKFKTEKWTPEEDAYLLEIIDLCRIANYIPWGKVSYYIRDRTRSQIYMRYKYTLSPDLKKGKFSLEEDVLLLGLINKYGKNYSKIAMELPNRTAVQIRERYTNVLQHEGCAGGKWTIAEDEQIVNHVKTRGTDKWAELAKVFVSERIRSRTHLRHRYTVLKKFFTKYPDADISRAPRHKPRSQNIVTEEIRKKITDSVNEKKACLRVKKTLFPNQIEMPERSSELSLKEIRSELASVYGKSKSKPKKSTKKTLLDKKKDVRKFPNQIEMPERSPEWSLKEIRSELPSVYGKNKPKPKKPIKKRKSINNNNYLIMFRTMIYSIFKFIKENKNNETECKLEARYLLIVLRLLNFTVNIPEINNSSELIVCIHQLKNSALSDPLDTDPLNGDLSELFDPNFNLNYFISIIINFKKIVHYVYWNDECLLKDLVKRKWGKLELTYDFNATFSEQSLDYDHFMPLNINKQGSVKTYAKNKNDLMESSEQLTNPVNGISSNSISHTETTTVTDSNLTSNAVGMPGRIYDIQRDLKQLATQVVNVGSNDNYTQGERYQCQEIFKTRLFALFTLPSLRKMTFPLLDEYAIVGEKIIQDNKPVKEPAVVRQKGRPRKNYSDRIKLMNEVKMKKKLMKSQAVDAKNVCVGEKRQLSDTENANQGENVAKKLKIDILGDIKIAV